MRTFYDQAAHRLRVDIRPEEPVGEGVTVANHPGVREFRRENNVVRYMVDNVDDPQQQASIGALAYGWMTARPGVGMGNELEAIKLLKEWCTWLVAIETGVIAAIAAMQKDVDVSGVVHGVALNDILRYVACFIIAAFGVSIYWAIHMLLSLPAMAQRVLQIPPGEDIYSLQNPVTERRLVTYVRWIRWASVAGLALFVAATIVAVVLRTHPTLYGV